MTVRVMALALLATITASAPAFATEPIGLEPCEALAAQAKAQAAQGATVRTFTLSRDHILAPLVVLAKRSQASPAMSAKLARLATDWAHEEFVEVQPVDGTASRAIVTQGTLRCEDDVFYRAGRGGALAGLPAPPAYSELCWTSGREAGAVSGKPAVIEIEMLDRPVIGADVEVTPWANGWGKSCRLSLRYDDVFRLSETFCRDPAVCRAGAALAPKLARVFAHNPKSDAAMGAVAPPPPGVPKIWADAGALASKIPPDERSSRPALATFGAKPKTEFPDYTDAMTAVAVQVGGQTLLANVGIGGVGWRAMGDYLITLYRWDGGALHPVAGYVVERRLGKLSSATTSVPKPYVDNR